MKLSDELDTILEFCRHIPVDVERMARALNIDLNHAYLGREISGMIESKGDTYKITINADHHPNRKRFTIAHEIGHYMLHRNLIGDGLDDDKMYRSTSEGKYHNTDVGPRQETEANQFAANILMPYKKIEQVANERGLNINLHEDAIKLAELFEVSSQAMKIRLGLK